MKKNLFMSLIAVMALSSVPCFAQNTCDASNIKCNKEKCENLKTNKCDKVCGNKLDPFEGLNLTDVQRQQIDSINPPCAYIQKGQYGESKVNAQEGRKLYLSQLATILTPEQYVKYLENQVINMPSPRMQGGKMLKMDKKDGKFAKYDKQKGDKSLYKTSKKSK